MTWQNIVIYAVVAGVGFPAAFRFFPPAIRNITALAMVVAWVVAELYTFRTGESLPLSFYFMADLAVIAVIYAKTIKRCGLKTYPSMMEQLRCLVTDLTKWDRGIVAIFLLGAWPLYVLNLHPYYKWQGLLWLAVLQFLLAGGEAVAMFVEERRKAAKPPSIIDRHLIVIPFPVQCRDAEAVRKTPGHSGAMLIARRGGGYG